MFDVHGYSDKIAIFVYELLGFEYVMPAGQRFEPGLDGCV
jgi:hypothetical protein